MYFLFINPCCWDCQRNWNERNYFHASVWANLKMNTALLLFLGYRTGSELTWVSGLSTHSLVDTAPFTHSSPTPALPPRYTSGFTVQDLNKSIWLEGFSLWRKFSCEPDNRVIGWEAETWEFSKTLHFSRALSLDTWYVNGMEGGGWKRGCLYKFHLVCRGTSQECRLVPSSLEARAGFDLQMICGDFLILSTSILKVERPLQYRKGWGYKQRVQRQKPPAFWKVLQAESRDLNSQSQNASVPLY